MAQKEGSGGFDGALPSRTKLATETAQEWVRKKWGDYKPCPYCGATEWVLTATVYLEPAMPDETRENIVTDHVAFPVTCTGCGNTVLINANFPGSEG